MNIPLKEPTRWQSISLKIMILTGVGSMFYYLSGLLKKDNIGYAPFYWLLMVAVFYACARLLHEWYHYFYITIPKTKKANKIYSVDILTTFCKGEPYDMIIETLNSIKKITYPHTTYLCDEANDPYLKNLCDELEVVHVTRTLKIDAKAGNINNALQIATGELCVVLDPDHVPDSNFLDPIIPHFNNPEVGFVQIVQSYKNADETLVAKGAAQQTYQFYGPMMMTMNRYGTVLAIGANCTFRRKALDSIGGHAAGLSEDMHTAMQLHAKGWKSVYVPAVLARGLVPSTLSAYYSQQLKWSRGTFELLITSYLKLFSKFTWRQKLHYGTIPFHYLCGIVYFLNFLIPVLCLFFDIIPLKMDIVSFGLIALPLYASMLLIRHYVQRWVMEENERGFHIVGGLLLIGTWWIYILGFVYTILRKKVPYVPTPKDSSQPDSWSINYPNLLVALVSVVAIVYGVSYDWNPYTFLMAGIAGVNVLVLLFVVIASRQSHIRALRRKYQAIDIPLKKIFRVKEILWIIRHFLYSLFRKIALPIIILCVMVTTFSGQIIKKMKFGKKVAVGESNFFLSGIYYPAFVNGVSSVSAIQSLEKSVPVKFNIISTYIAWGEEGRCYLPKATLDSIYNNQCYPMITWEPWQSLFTSLDTKKLDLKQDKNVFRNIQSGIFDNYINRFADDVKKLNKPVFLRFAHEPENPAYPWSPKNGNSNKDFKKAWIYIVKKFRQRGAGNAIWVWNPWKAETAKDYFPGKNYVDWISITGLNYGRLGETKKWYSFSSIYEPFNQLNLFHQNIPVMVGEMGSLRSEEGQDKWFAEAFDSIKTKYSNIKGMVLFYSNKDANNPLEQPSGVLDWSLKDKDAVLHRISSDKLTDTNYVKLVAYDTLNHTAARARSNRDLGIYKNVKGINYDKAIDWFKNYHSLTKRELIKDFDKIKNLGINTIKRNGPGIYDKNIIDVAREKGLKVQYGFPIPKEYLSLSSERKLAYKEDVLAKVESLKEDTTIIGWTILNFHWDLVKMSYFKPELFEKENEYMGLVRDIASAIKKMDRSRPVLLDVEFTVGSANDFRYIYESINSIDGIGVVLRDKGLENIMESKLHGIPYCYGTIPAELLEDAVKEKGIFIEEWQDKNTRTFVSFNGLLDLWGNKKQSYIDLSKVWFSKNDSSQLPHIKILQPANIIEPGKKVTYSAFYKKEDSWLEGNTLSADVQFKWALIKTDKYGKAIAFEVIGEGPTTTITIPENYNLYKVYLVAYRNGYSVDTKTSLNTYLFPKPKNFKLVSQGE